ncbi:MAG: hypothetical protein C0593_13845 [Marinilabiliales bacterium]|nr:MAG: hypothetical protein C0593_13845 [Marinilabiliales bacterium]
MLSLLTVSTHVALTKKGDQVQKLGHGGFSKNITQSLFLFSLSKSLGGEIKSQYVNINHFTKTFLPIQCYQYRKQKTIKLCQKLH